MRLRDFCDSHEERLRQRHLVLDFIIAPPFLESRAAHYELAWRDQHELHPDWVPQLDPHAEMLRPRFLMLFRLLCVERCHSGLWRSVVFLLGLHRRRSGQQTDTQHSVVISQTHFRLTTGDRLTPASESTSPAWHPETMQPVPAVTVTRF